MDGAEHMDVVVFPKNLVRDRLDGGKSIDAGVIDKDVQTAVGLFCSFKQFLHVCGTGDVGLNGDLISLNIAMRDIKIFDDTIFGYVTVRIQEEMISIKAN